MKKFFAITLILTIIIFAACIPTFAAEAPSYTTPKTFSDNDSDVRSDIIYSDRALNELPPERVELSDAEKLKMAQDYEAQYYISGNPEKYTVICFKTLSNGMKLVYVEVDEPYEWLYPPTEKYSFLGKYGYRHSTNKDVRLYQDGVYTTFHDAYYNGLIDDAILDEIHDVMHFDRYADSEEPADITDIRDNLPSQTIELSDAEKLKMAQDYKAQYNTEGDPQLYAVLCFKELSNGMKLVFVGPNKGTYTSETILESLGKYVYSHGRRDTVRLYQNGVYTTFYDAYQNGLIDDALLDEIHDVMHFDIYVEPTAEPTQADETKADDTQSATQKESRKKDTPDKPATPDSSTNSNATPTNSAVVQTGSAQLAVLFLTMLTIAAFIVVFLKKRKAY